jgi:alkylation response protein AidB-like acyl-CoA dehydrogenase
MLVELPDELYELRQSLDRLLAERAGPATLRAHWDGAADGSLGVWPELAAMGLATLSLPAAEGGEGLPLVAAVPALELFGVHAVPQPVAETVGVVCPALAREAEGSPARDLLRRIAAGELMATLQEGWAGHAPWAQAAGLVLVLDGDAAILCQPGPDDVEPLEGVDLSRRPGRVLPGAEIERLRAPEAAASVRRDALIAAAATLFGLAEAVIWRSVEYAQARRQFGRQIGEFQAVKHLLADAYVGWEFSRRYVWFAAWAAENMAPAGALVAAVRAKALAGDVATAASYAGLQVHGGIGYTWEHDLHLWLKRIQVVDGALGSSERHWRWLASQPRDAEHGLDD